MTRGTTVTILSRKTLDEMHAAARTILSRTGFNIPHPEIREILLARDGFTESNGRICIETRLIDELAELLRESFAEETNDDSSFILGTDDRCTLIVDKDAQSIRRMNRDDVIAGAKLIRMLENHNLSGTTPGQPSDVPQALQPLQQYLIAAEYSRNGGATSQITDVVTAGIVLEMDKVYGRRYTPSTWILSPLEFAGTEVDIVWHYRHEATSVTAGSMPIMGLTGPCDPIGIYTLAIAEVLGAAAIWHALLPEVRIDIFPHPQPADMRTGGIVFGTPEWQLLDLMKRDVLRYYGKPYNAKLCLTSASLPGPQAQIERSSSILLASQRGYNEIRPLGQLANDEVWSPAQLMLDLDIVAYARRIDTKIESAPELTPPALPDIVDQVVSSGCLFAEHESTLSTMRRQYQQPALLQRYGHSQWASAGKPSVIRDAQHQANELIADYDLEPPEDILKELRTIYERGKEKLLLAKP